MCVSVHSLHMAKGHVRWFHEICAGKPMLIYVSTSSLLWNPLSESSHFIGVNFETNHWHCFTDILELLVFNIIDTKWWNISEVRAPKLRFIKKIWRIRMISFEQKRIQKIIDSNRRDVEAEKSVRYSCLV